MENFPEDLGGVSDRMAGYEEPSPSEWTQIAESFQDAFGDTHLEVVRASAGTGSFYMYGENTVLLDPRQVYDAVDYTRGIRRGLYEALHDGAHAIISRTPHELGMLKTEVDTKYSVIGYPFLQTVMEDAAVNRWVAKKVPRAKDVLLEA